MKRELDLVSKRLDDGFNQDIYSSVGLIFLFEFLSYADRQGFFDDEILKTYDSFSLNAFKVQASELMEDFILNQGLTKEDISDYEDLIESLIAILAVLKDLEESYAAAELVIALADKTPDYLDEKDMKLASYKLSNQVEEIYLYVDDEDIVAKALEVIAWLIDLSNEDTYFEEKHQILKRQREIRFASMRVKELYLKEIERRRL